MKKPGVTRSRAVWTPSKNRVGEANITGFTEFVNQKYALNFNKYSELYDWSISKVAEFWSAVWDYTGIVSSRKYDRVVDDLDRFPGAQWFQGARLNFAENLLKHRDDNIALISRSEEAQRFTLSHNDLYRRVGSIAKWMRRIGISPGDRVVGYLSNTNETTIAMLAATSLGAVWACCGNEIGPSAAIDRLGQLSPRLLFTASRYVYKGREVDVSPNAEKVAKALSSLAKTVVVAPKGVESGLIDDATGFDEILASERDHDIQFAQLPADHPVYIMFSSGTTGKPKCMVQGAAGLLVNQLKEIVLHADVKNSDRVTYITSPSWMMWNWLMSCLAVGSSIVLYDGNPAYPDWRAMWKLVSDEKITVFGCSASYINYLRSVQAHPGSENDLGSLREISQTGSPLSSEGFEWVYREIKSDLHLNSISGGTDINGCFAGGVPTLPVYPGELQAPGLGMKVKAYDQNAIPVWDQMGELVCEAPAPSMPLYFWNDPENKRYREAYFEYYQPQGKNVWRHGDYVMFHSDTGGVSFYGRSDAVIKPSGVRIGTSEIYNVIENIPEVSDSLAVGQNWKNDQRIILFVKMGIGHQLTDALREEIRKKLREEASPRHVPAMILEVPEIPYTFNMKKVEMAVANIINNIPVTNRAVLANPNSLDYYERLRPNLQRD